jgi:hypothetical protein
LAVGAIPAAAASVARNKGRMADLMLRKVGHDLLRWPRSTSGKIRIVLQSLTSEEGRQFQ